MAIMTKHFFLLSCFLIISSNSYEQLQSKQHKAMPLELRLEVVQKVTKVCAPINIKYVLKNNAHPAYFVANDYLTLGYKERDDTDLYLEIRYKNRKPYINYKKFQIDYDYCLTETGNKGKILALGDSVMGTYNIQTFYPIEEKVSLEIRAVYVSQHRNPKCEMIYSPWVNVRIM